MTEHQVRAPKHLLAQDLEVAARSGEFAACGGKPGIAVSRHVGVQGSLHKAQVSVVKINKYLL